MTPSTLRQEEVEGLDRHTSGSREYLAPTRAAPMAHLERSRPARGFESPTPSSDVMHYPCDHLATPRTPDAT